MKGFSREVRELGEQDLSIGPLKLDVDIKNMKVHHNFYFLEFSVT